VQTTKKINDDKICCHKLLCEIIFFNLFSTGVFVTVSSLILNFELFTALFHSYNFISGSRGSFDPSTISENDFEIPVTTT
jgi:hypothetical protein